MRAVQTILGVLFLTVVFSTASSAEELLDSGWGRPYCEMQFSGIAGGSHHGWRAGFDFVIAGGAKGFDAAFIAPIRFDASGFRIREFDEPNDFGRLVHNLQYRDRKGHLDIAVRSLAGYTLGMGNLVSMMNSTVDVDHWRTGLGARLHWGVAGGDLFIDAVTGPSVFGARAYFRPLWFVDHEGQVGRLEIGASFTTDLFAPSNLGSGTPDNAMSVLPGGSGLVSYDPGALTGWSVDLSWPVRASGQVELKPWAAWSRLGDADAFNAGLEIATLLPGRVRLSLSGQYDFMEPGFAAGYFDNLYMADRHDFAVWRDTLDGAVSKKAFIASSQMRRHGGSAGVLVAWEPWLSAWLRVDVDQQGDFTRIRSGLSVKVPGRLNFSGTLIARGFGPDNSDPLAARLFAVFSADVTVWKYIGVFASYSRDLHVPLSGGDIGRYMSGDTGLAGVRFSFGLMKE